MCEKWVYEQINDVYMCLFLLNYFGRLTSILHIGRIYRNDFITPLYAYGILLLRRLPVVQKYRTIYTDKRRMSIVITKKMETKKQKGRCKIEING